ncbi:short-chain dehydrogenase [Pseudalkalibacillus sp. SCS-8]|uniref:short-chain dehydrogenase n=1 Tax=Pseudalkalibacillus nanhaiensis TaxID=3115291 RepID=UPI0032DBCB42
MKRRLPYFAALIVLSFLLFFIVAGFFKTDNATDSFLLAMIVSHLIIGKNPWLIELFRFNISD